MKTVLFANHIFALPCIQYLASTASLQAVVLPSVVHSYNQQVAHFAEQCEVPVHRIAQEELTTLAPWLQSQGVELALAFTFPYRIPASLLEIPSKGFFNVHFSLLPRYRGADPVFWQIKNGDEKGGVTIHKMERDFDQGPIVLQDQVNLGKGENYGAYATRLSHAAVHTVQKALVSLKASPSPVLVPQDHKAKTLYARPQQKDLRIDWQRQDAAAIENLVNACMPYGGGGVTTLCGQEIRILEVSTWPNISTVVNLLQPGTVIATDPQQGTLVACEGNTTLRINIVQSAEGIMSGYKLASLGLKEGVFFR